MNIFREVADVQTADMLDLDVPALRGGKPIIVESEPDWYVKQVMEDFVVRAERIRGGGVDPSEDNFLKITHEARLLGTDARLIDKDAPNNPDGKLNKVAENVWKEYEKGNANGHIGCQLIFSDIGTPGPDKDFTIYDYLKETLIQYGIPADEIAFIHDAKTDAQRDALFKEMRTGKKKVLIGSTDKWEQVSMCRHTLLQCTMSIVRGSLLLLNRGKDEAYDKATKMKRWQSTDMSPKEPLMHTTGHSSRISSVLSVRL